MVQRRYLPISLQPVPGKPGQIQKKNDEKVVPERQYGGFEFAAQASSSE